MTVHEVCLAAKTVSIQNHKCFATHEEQYKQKTTASFITTKHCQNTLKLGYCVHSFVEWNFCMSVVTRFAPSPTGYLHIGGLRTALYAFLFARKMGGKMLLRIEDTDQTRFVEGALENLIRTLSICGISYDEGPVLTSGGGVEQKGDHGPYIQSERLPTYQHAARQLVEAGHAYYCFCTKERLTKLREQQQIAKTMAKYDRHCLHLSKEEREARRAKGESCVVRLHVPEGSTTFVDMIRGAITFQHSEVDDQVLLKSDGFPTYHLAVVVDDHDMEVTHVIRGEEWLSSTPKHIMLYHMFGWDVPHMAHLPLILNPDRSKLSKRQGDVAVEDFIGKGYLPEALVNFVALIGWNPSGDQEIYSLAELMEQFDITKVNKGGGVFNREKLDWMNSQYIRRLSQEELIHRLEPFLPKAAPAKELLERIVKVEQERLVTLQDIEARLRVYTELPTWPEKQILVWKKSTPEETVQVLKDLLHYVQNLEASAFASVQLLEETTKAHIAAMGWQVGTTLWPMRVALSGEAVSPSPFELAYVFQKTGTLERLQAALTRLTM